MNELMNPTTPGVPSFMPDFGNSLGYISIIKWIYAQVISNNLTLQNSDIVREK